MALHHNSFLGNQFLVLSGQTSLSSGNNNYLKLICIILLLLVMDGCGNSSTAFKSFDSALWKSEVNHCNHYRIGTIEDMEAEFDLFLGMSETELIKHLGNPNKTHLYTRGQKFFTYQLVCGDSVLEKKILRIRFSALDQVNELIVLD